MRVIALDASTTTIGISIFSYNNKIQLLHYEYYKPNKKVEILEMIKQTRKYILDMCLSYNITHFVIEDFTRFMKGKSTAATIIPLAILNMSLRLACQDAGYNVTALNVMKIRHTIKKSKILPKKEEIPRLVADILEMDEFPLFYKKTEKREVMNFI